MKCLFISYALFFKDPEVNDDMLLEVVVLCGTFCQDESCASTLVQAGLPQLLIACLKSERLFDTISKGRPLP